MPPAPMAETISLRAELCTRLEWHGIKASLTARQVIGNRFRRVVHPIGVRQSRGDRP